MHPFTTAGPAVSLATAALAYAARGWAVFPVWPARHGSCTCAAAEDCAHPGKHPMSPRGLYDATSDVDVIESTWGMWPQASIAISCGASNLAVLDVDDGGLASMAALSPPAPPTFLAQTGSGGWHLYYRCPEGQAGCNTVGRLGPGLDSRGAGGYVIAPPSGHVSGGRYVWHHWSPTIDPPEAPPWLLKQPPKPPTAAPAAPRRRRRHTRYGQAALERLYAELRVTPEGARNHRLNWTSFRLGQLEAAGEVALRPALPPLVRIAEQIGLGREEITATVRSGVKAGRLNPRGAP